MHKLLILAAVVACCLAAPGVQEKASKDDALLHRPSPINPDVISDPKPEEKVTIITDPKEVAKHKREAGLEQDIKVPDLTPTAQPAIDQHQHQYNYETHAADASDIATPEHLHERNRRDLSPKPDNEHKSKSEHEQDHAHPHQGAQQTHVPATPLTSVVPPAATENHHHHKRDDTHANSHHAAPEHAVPQTLPAAINGPHSGDVRPQTLPDLNRALQANTHQAAVAAPHVHTKRDIPVPLEPKHHHPDESPKDGENAEHSSVSGTSSSTASVPAVDASTTAHPVIRPHPVPVAELFGRPPI